MGLLDKFHVAFDDLWIVQWVRLFKMWPPLVTFDRLLGCHSHGFLLRRGHVGGMMDWYFYGSVGSRLKSEWSHK